MPALSLVHDEDPGHKILREAGDLDEIEVFNHRVLVGVYERPAETKTKGGILISEQTVSEDKFQSKVGIILKMGPKAFHDDKGFYFQDVTFNVGDWVAFRSNDGLAMKLVSAEPKREQLCRLMEDTSILMRISSIEPADRIY